MNDKENASSLHREQQHAREYGCSGLVGGWATNRLNGKRFHAPSATKDDGPFVCHDCWSDAILRKCTEISDHFAHHARTSPVVSKGESELHLACKHEVLEALCKMYPEGKWESERIFKANPKTKLRERRPDLSGYISAWRVVIEFQASTLSIREIISRTLDYSRRECFVIWVVPLKEDLGRELFIPRLYERYFHSIYFGRTYYWLPGDGASLRPVHYDIASRWIEENSWYDTEEQEEKTAGGYEKNYVIVKRPNQGSIVSLNTHDFCASERVSFVPWNAKKSIPKCRILRDRHRPWWNDALEQRKQKDYYRYT